jgi:hypothetical protein
MLIQVTGQSYNLLLNMSCKRVGLRTARRMAWSNWDQKPAKLTGSSQLYPVWRHSDKETHAVCNTCCAGRAYVWSNDGLVGFGEQALAKDA